MKKMSIKTLAAGALLLVMLVGIFLPWYGGESLFSMILLGFGVGGSLSGASWGEIGGIVTEIFVIFAILVVGALLFGVRAVVTSLKGKIKGLTPAGTLMSVLAIGALGIAIVLEGIASAQIGVWLCLIAGLAETVWGIFN